MGQILQRILLLISATMSSNSDDYMLQDDPGGRQRESRHALSDTEESKAPQNAPRYGLAFQAQHGFEDGP